MQQPFNKRQGRQARRSNRLAPPDPNTRPVKPGQISGRFTPLSDVDIKAIYDNALAILAEIGMGQAIPSCLNSMVNAGCTLTEAGRLLIPPHLVERALNDAARDITLYSRNGDWDLKLNPGRVYTGTGGAAVHMVDAQSGDYRDSTLVDIFELARIVDRMEHIHFFQRMVVARDIGNNYDLDINTLYASLSGTGKHIGSSWFEADTVYDSAKLLASVAGSETAWRRRPFVSMSNCFVVPPLKFAEDACYCLEAAVNIGMPILLLSAGQAGATSPASLAGSIAQATAEVLAAVTWVNIIKPGHPIIMGCWPFVSDLRTGAMSGGSGEQAILASGAGQVAHYLGLPCGTAAGMTDAKVPNVQHGAEKAYTIMAAAHSGANMIYETAGMHASIMGSCLESLVIDNDILGAINRTIRGIEVTTESLSFSTIKDVVLNGPGHYLGSDQTMQLMQRDYLYPKLFDRLSPKDWLEQDKPDPVEKAHQIVRQILAEPHRHPWGDDIDSRIRTQFNIALESVL